MLYHGSKVKINDQQIIFRSMCTILLLRGSSTARIVPCAMNRWQCWWKLKKEVHTYIFVFFWLYLLWFFRDLNVQIVKSRRTGPLLLSNRIYVRNLPLHFPFLINIGQLPASVSSDFLQYQRHPRYQLPSPSFPSSFFHRGVTSPSVFSSNRPPLEMTKCLNTPPASKQGYGESRVTDAARSQRANLPFRDD